MWNFADVWDAAADRRGLAPAQIHGDEIVTWTAFRERARAIGSWLHDRGLPHQATIAQLQRNSSAYLQVIYGAFGASYVPFNTNFRYRADEIVDLWSDAAAAAVVFQSSLTEVVEAARRNLPSVRAWICEDDAGRGVPPWADDLALIVASSDVAAPPWKRSPDDLYLLYTGGTTGTPKGVEWRQDDLFRLLNDRASTPLAEGTNHGAIVGALAPCGPMTVLASPLMHGAGAFRAFSTFNDGGCVVTLTAHRFDPAEVFDAVDRHRATTLAVVGDAICVPLVAELERGRDRWDLSSLELVTSAGVLLSESVIRRLIDFLPGLVVVDSFGSSEAPGMASARWSGATSYAPRQFEPSPHTRLLDDDGTWIDPASPRSGLIAKTGSVALRYRNHPEATARVFPCIDGQRWVVPGDHGYYDSSGRVVVMGRGSSCINTGGEKVFPDEVETVIRELTYVSEVAVVGVADERFGESVAAVVVFRDGETGTGRAAARCEAVSEHVRNRLAPFKVPRRVVAATTLKRLANGKLDVGRIRDAAAATTDARPDGRAGASDVQTEAS